MVGLEINSTSRASASSKSTKTNAILAASKPGIASNDSSSLRNATLLPAAPPIPTTSGPKVGSGLLDNPTKSPDLFVKGRVSLFLVCHAAVVALIIERQDRTLVNCVPQFGSYFRLDTIRTAPKSPRTKLYWRHRQQWNRLQGSLSNQHGSHATT